MDPSPRRLSGRDALPLRRRLLQWFVPRGERRWLRRVRWGRLAGVSVGGMAAAYVALAMFGFWFVHHHRGLSSVGFADIALPWRWNHYRVARGNQHVETARRLAGEGNYREALMFVRAGLAKSPGNRDGRLLLAELMVAGRGPKFARQTLVDGLAFHATDPLYLNAVLGFLLEQQEDAEVVSLAERHLRESAADSDPARVLAMGAATASYFRGNYDQAEDFLRRVPRLAQSREGRLLGAKMEIDRGYRELGLWQLRQLAAEMPGDVEVHRELMHQLREHGLADEARRAGIAFQLAHPSLPGPRIELLRAYLKQGDMARFAREADAVLADFGADRDALLALAELGANAGDVALVRRVATHAAERGLPLEPYRGLEIEAAINSGDYRGALESLRLVSAGNLERDERYLALFDSLQAIAHTGLGDMANARPCVLQFLSRRNLRADNLVTVANRLAALSGNDLARQTLLRAIEIDPLNQAALARLIEFDLILNRVDDLPGHVQQFVQMRRPSREILRVVQHKLGSDLFLFSREAPAALERMDAVTARR